MRRVAVIITIVVVTSLAVVGNSLAGNSVVTGHNPAPSVSSNLGTFKPPSSPTSGTLPFTGLDLAGITAIAAAVLGGGLILARSGRKAR